MIFVRSLYCGVSNLLTQGERAAEARVFKPTLFRFSFSILQYSIKQLLSAFSSFQFCLHSFLIVLLKKQGSASILQSSHQEPRPPEANSEGLRLSLSTLSSRATTNPQHSIASAHPKMSTSKTIPTSRPTPSQQQPTPRSSRHPSARSTPAPGPSTPQRANLATPQTTPGSGMTYTCSSGHLRTFIPPPCECGCQEMHNVQVVPAQTSSHTNGEVASDENDGSENGDGGLKWKWRCERERLHLHELGCDKGECEVRSLWGLPKLLI